jgi:hypothetical protein
VTSVREPFVATHADQTTFLDEMRMALPLIDDSPMQQVPSESGTFHVMLEAVERPSVAFGVLARPSVSPSTAQALLKNFNSSWQAFAQNNAGGSSRGDVRSFDAVLEKSVQFVNRTLNDPINTTLQAANDLAIHLTTTTLPLILDRHAKIETLVEKTSKLDHTSTNFRHSATKTRQRYCFESIKMVLLLLCIVAVLGYVVAALMCGGPLLHQCVTPARNKH